MKDIEMDQKMTVYIQWKVRHCLAFYGGLMPLS